MQCSSCEFSKKIASGEVPKDTPYEDTPCASCDGRCRDRHVLEYDDRRAGVPVPPVEVRPVEFMPVGVLAVAMRELLRLKVHELLAIQLRYEGLSFKDIGLQLGISKDAAHKRVASALRTSPVLETLLPKYVHVGNVGGD